MDCAGADSEAVDIVCSAITGVPVFRPVNSAALGVTAPGDGDWREHFWQYGEGDAKFFTNILFPTGGGGMVDGSPAAYRDGVGDVLAGEVVNEVMHCVENLLIRLANSGWWRMNQSNFGVSSSQVQF
jgi:hypothetical protein